MDEKNTQSDQHDQNNQSSPQPEGEMTETTTTNQTATAGDTDTSAAPYESNAAPAANTATEAAEKSIPWTFIIAVLLVIGLLAGGVWWLSTNGNTAANVGAPADGNTPAASIFSTEDYPEVIAVVNGIDVSSDRFVQGLEQAAQQAAQQGANPEDEAVRSQIETQTTTALVNTELLKQAAEAAGVTADEAAINAEIDAVVQQFGSEEEFQNQLEAAGISIEQLRSDFQEQLTIDAYVRQTPEWGSVTIEDGEAQAFYDDIAVQSDGQELPAFAEVEAAIEEQLLGTKQQEITQEIIDRLRSVAEIEVLI